MPSASSPTRNDAATNALVTWAEQVAAETTDPFRRAQRIARRLGAHVTPTGTVEIGMWIPEVTANDAAPSEANLSDVVLEVLTPPPDLELTAPEHTVAFERHLLTPTVRDDIAWIAVDGMRAGTRDTVGAFYWMRYRDSSGVWPPLHDDLAHSVPFGAFAPAEVYDMNRLQADRADRDYWETLADDPYGLLDGARQGVPCFGPPDHILQIHPGTATGSGSLAGLTRRYREIARKMEAGEPLTPAEETFAGYDAVQLMPVEPTIEYENGPDFWTEADPFDPGADSVSVDLRAPDMTNWGYDIVISASSAVNPALLETRRPDELVDLIATLHTFPTGPIRVIFDVVFGHVDNQALGLLPDAYLAGPGMYGMNLDYQHPRVRAILLEMQRRKVNFGADGVRTDGAQDFTFWDPETQQLYHDDDYLQEMSDVVQEVGGTRYHPWMIFEDGRPWPQEDWELSSTYRAVIEQQPDVFQWGPLTFAHNTPFLFTFWIGKWWRIDEVASVGGNWISGCANHDTLRRGAQVDPEERINTFLGDALPAIIQNAYDNPAAQMLTYGLFPGVPMDFVNAFMRAPWSFIRNTDDRYGVKVVSEEANFIDWRIPHADFANPDHFRRLKALGFSDRDGLHRFWHTLDHAVQASQYDLPAVAKMMRAVDPPLDGPDDLTVDALKRVARAWMDDLHDFCNLAHYTDAPDATRTALNRALRRFRSERPWLMQAFRNGDALRYRTPANGTVLVHGVRHAPDGNGSVAFVGNMEGAPATVVPADLLAPLAEADWRLVLSSPGVAAASAHEAITLSNSESLLLVA